MFLYNCSFKDENVCKIDDERLLLNYLMTAVNLYKIWENTIYQGGNYGRAISGYSCIKAHNRAALRDVTHQRAVLLECSHVTRVCHKSGKVINMAGGENSRLLVCPVSLVWCYSECCVIRAVVPLPRRNQDVIRNVVCLHK